MSIGCRIRGSIIRVHCRIISSVSSVGVIGRHVPAFRSQYAAVAGLAHCVQQIIVTRAGCTIIGKVSAIYACRITQPTHFVHRAISFTRRASGHTGLHWHIPEYAVHFPKNHIVIVYACDAVGVTNFDIFGVAGIQGEREVEIGTQTSISASPARVSHHQVGVTQLHQ